jgi:riboflavin-specific deaminase-like protein
MRESHLVDRLWPDPAGGIPLDAAFFPRPMARPDRPWVAINMVTSIDGRAQLHGTADGLGGRTDRRMMQAYRVAFDAVASGVGTLRADDFFSRLADDLAQARGTDGRSAQPLAVVIAGEHPVPTSRRWFGYADQERVVAVGSRSPHASDDKLPGVETWVAPSDHPAPAWLLERLAARGVGSLLLEGGPTLNAAFLADGMVDEMFWTIGPRVVGNESARMVASIGPDGLEPPTDAQLVSIHRHADELYLRYRLEPQVGSVGP